MASKSKVRISEKSALPIVAAVLSFLAAVLTLVGKWQILKGFPLFYAIMTVIFPITAFLLFTVFALIFAKKHLLLMLIPIFMICIQHILNESGVYTTLLYGVSSGYYRWMLHNNPAALVLTILACLLTLIIFIVCSATFAGAVKTKLPLIVLCVLDIFVNIALQLWYFASGTQFVIPWYMFSVIVFLCAFILLASDLQNSAAMQGPAPGLMNPPFPGMPPYPSNAMNQQAPNQGMPAVNQQMAFKDQSMMDRQRRYLGQPGQQMPYQGQPMMNQQMPYPRQPMMNQQMPYPGQPMMNQQMPYPGQPMMNQQMPYPGQPMMNQQMPYAGQPMMNQQMPYPGQPMVNQQMPYPGQPVMNQQMPYPGQPMVNQQMPYPGQPVMNQQMPYAGQPMMNQQMPYPSQPVMNQQVPYPNQQEGWQSGYQAEQYISQPAPERIQGAEVKDQMQQADAAGQIQEALAAEQIQEEQVQEAAAEQQVWEAEAIRQVQEAAATQEQPEEPAAEAQLPGQE